MLTHSLFNSMLFSLHAFECFEFFPLVSISFNCFDIDYFIPYSGYGLCLFVPPVLVDVGLSWLFEISLFFSRPVLL